MVFALVFFGVLLIFFTAMRIYVLAAEDAAGGGGGGSGGGGGGATLSLHCFAIFSYHHPLFRSSPKRTSLSSSS